MYSDGATYDAENDYRVVNERDGIMLDGLSTGGPIFDILDTENRNNIQNAGTTRTTATLKSENPLVGPVEFPNCENRLQCILDH